MARARIGIHHLQRHRPAAVPPGLCKHPLDEQRPDALPASLRRHCERIDAQLAGVRALVAVCQPHPGLPPDTAEGSEFITQDPRRGPEQPPSIRVLHANHPQDLFAAQGKETHLGAQTAPQDPQRLIARSGKHLQVVDLELEGLVEDLRGLLALLRLVQILGNANFGWVLHRFQG